MLSITDYLSFQAWRSCAEICPRPESCWALTLLVDLDGDYQHVDVKTGLAEVCAEMAILRERLSAADV